MTSRRKFIAQASIAAASMVLLEPFKSAARISGFSAVSPQAIAILDIGNLHQWWQNSPAFVNGFDSLRNMVQSLRRNNDYSLFLLTGNNVPVKNASGNEQLDLLKNLRRIGCDAVVPGPADLAFGSEHYERVVMESGIDSLWTKDAGQFLLPYKIFQMGYRKVAVIGTKGMIAGETSINDINNTAEHLKGCESCDLIFSINTFADDDTNNKKQITASEKSADINLILSRNSPSKYFKAFSAKNKDDQEVLISFSGYETGSVKKLALSFDNNFQSLNLEVNKVV